MVSPLTQLTKKDQPFSWTDECEACFKDMKRRLTTVSVLAICGLCIETVEGA